MFWVKQSWMVNPVITEKGREYIRLKDEEAQLRQQHASPDTQKIEKKSFGAHLLLTSLAVA